jgi:hypothetical protein
MTYMTTLDVDAVRVFVTIADLQSLTVRPKRSTPRRAPSA